MAGTRNRTNAVADSRHIANRQWLDSYYSLLRRCMRAEKWDDSLSLVSEALDKVRSWQELIEHETYLLDCKVYILERLRDRAIRDAEKLRAELEAHR